MTILASPDNGILSFFHRFSYFIFFSVCFLLIIDFSQGDLVGGLGDCPGEFLPQWSRHVLRHQRVLRLDLGHRVGHVVDKGYYKGKKALKKN